MNWVSKEYMHTRPRSGKKMEWKLFVVTKLFNIAVKEFDAI